MFILFFPPSSFFYQTIRSTTNSEIVREALRDWKLKRALQQQEVEELRRLWQEGLHSGPSRFVGMADLKAEARRRLEAQSQPGA